MLTTPKEIKEALRKLREQWDTTANYLDRTCGSSLNSDIASDLNRAQKRAVSYCSDELYYFIEAIDDTVINVESTVIVEEEKE